MLERPNAMEEEDRVCKFASDYPSCLRSKSTPAVISWLETNIRSAAKTVALLPMFCVSFISGCD